MKTKNFLKSIFLLFIALFILSSSQLNAANDLRNKLDNLDGNNTHIETIVKKGGINTETSLPSLVSSSIKLVLGLFGVIALIFIIRAGVMWMGSKGDSGKIRDARKIMTSGFIGLSIIALSYSVTDFFIKQISLTVNSSQTNLPDYVGGGESGNCIPMCNMDTNFNDISANSPSYKVCNNNSITGGMSYAISDNQYCEGRAIKTWDCVCDGIPSVSCYRCAP